MDYNTLVAAGNLWDPDRLQVTGLRARRALLKLLIFRYLDLADHTVWRADNAEQLDHFFLG